MTFRRFLFAKVICIAVPLALALFTGTSRAQSCTTPPSGLVSWWTGDSGAGDSGDSNHGTLVGAVLGSGQFSGAFSFDGINDYVNVPTTSSLNFGTGDFTVKLWVRFNDLDNAGNGLIHKDNYLGGSTYNGWLFNICDACGGVGWGTRNVVGGSGPDTQARWATSNFVTGRWYCLAGVRQSNVLKFYVDGILRATTAEATPTNVSNSIDMRFGALSAGSPQFFAGLEDEIEIYGRALSAAEIQNLVQAGAGGRCGPVACTQRIAGLTAWWPADVTAGDAVGSNDGTLMSGSAIASGFVGNAFSFDGVNDYVSVPNSPDLNFGTGDFTVQFWVQFNDLITHSNGLIHKDTYAGFLAGTYSGWLFDICDGCGGIGLETRNFVSGIGPNTHARYGTSNFAAGRWYHLAGVRQSGTLRLYVDGTLRTTSVESAPTNVSNTADMGFGALTAAAPQFFSGRLDEIEMYSRALTGTEVQAIFLAGSAGRCDPPTLTAPAGLTVNTDPGVCGATVVLGSPNVTNCSGCTVTNDAPAVFPVDTTTVTWSVTDGSTMATDTQVVIVEDHQNPTISAPADVTIGTDSGECQAGTVDLGSPTAGDNCPDFTLANDAPAQFPKGPTTVTWTITDASGNEATDTQVVNVEDQESPQVAPPADVIVGTGPAATQCGAVISDTVLGTAGFSDNCPDATVARSGVPAGHFFPVGETFLTHTATDDAGNTDSAMQSVVVNDDTPPSITAPANVAMSVAIAPVSAGLVSLGSPVVSDNCGISTVTNNAPMSFPSGVTTVTWTAFDIHGNSASAAQTVTITVTGGTATIEVVSALHTVGRGTNPGTTKTPLPLNIKVFNRAVVGSPGARDYGNVWNSTLGLVPAAQVQITGPSTISIGNGQANQYFVTVPSGAAYLVIGQAIVDGFYVYPGESTSSLLPGDTPRYFLQVLKNSNGKITPANSTPIPGSLLVIAEPAYMDFTSSEELYPIVYESVEGEWAVTVHADPPEGFVSSPATLSTTVVTDGLEALQFTIQDIGSDWSFTAVTHDLKHNGRRIAVKTKSRMINSQRGRGEGRQRHDETSTRSAAGTPLEFALHPNNPEPFNPTTMIRFDLPVETEVTLRVFDVFGREVAVLVDRRTMPAGYHEASFRPANLSSGTYFYRLEAGSFVMTRRMTLIK